MFIDLDTLDLVKGITRADAKGVHKDLPPGGSWKTIRGHHVYILGSKIVAGSIPGVTKAKKMTKAQMKEHQEHVDKETKKKEAASKTKKAAAKKEPAKKAAAKKEPAKKAAAKKEPAKKVSPTKKAPVAKPIPKTKQEPKLVVSPKKKPTPTNDKKPTSEELNVPKEFNSRETKQKYHRWTSTGFDKKAVPGIPVDLGHGEDGFLHQEGGSSAVYHAKTGSRLGMSYGMDDDSMRNAVISGRAMLQRVHDQKGAEGWRSMVDAFISKNGVSPRYDENGNVKKGYEVSESGKKTKAAIAEKHEKNHGKFYAQHGNGEFVHKPGASPIDVHNEFETFHHENKGTHHIYETKSGLNIAKGSTKAEAVNNAQAALQSMYEKGGNSFDKIQNHIKNKSEGNPRNVVNTTPAPEHPKEHPKDPKEHIEVFHGTKLAALQHILDNGFTMGGNDADFGHAAYFKSPAYDEKDQEDWKNKIAERDREGLPVPAKYREKRGHDTEDVVKAFAKGAVIHATVSKEHVLDCSQGRPKELQKLIDTLHNRQGEKPLRGLDRAKPILEYLGEPFDPSMDVNTANKTVAAAFEKHGIKAKHMGSVSPYELYAKKHGVKAVVDKLDEFTGEGWQIGVYDPSIIQIKGHGKSLAYNADKKGVELQKSQGKHDMPYCLLHHHMDEEGLHLFVGAHTQGEDDTIEKSLFQLRSVMKGW